MIGLSIHYFALATLFWMAVTIKYVYNLKVELSEPPELQFEFFCHLDLGDYVTRADDISRLNIETKVKLNEINCYVTGPCINVSKSRIHQYPLPRRISHRMSTYRSQSSAYTSSVGVSLR